MNTIRRVFVIMKDGARGWVRSARYSQFLAEKDAIGTERCSLRPYHRLKDTVLARSCLQPAVGIQACRPEAPKRGGFQKNTRPTQNERPGDSNALPRVDSYATNRRAKGSRRARSDVPSASPAVTIGVILLVADLRTAGWDRGRVRSGERRRAEERGGE